MIVCAAANPSVDRLFEVERLRHGEIHRPLSVTRVPGGKGLNVARAAAALRADVVAVALLAGHTGRWMEAALAAEGVPARVAWAEEGETRSSLSVADRATGSLTEFYEDGIPVTGASWGAFETAVVDAAAGAAWTTVSGSLPPGAPGGAYAGLVARVRDRGSRVAVDARGPALLDALGRRPDVVKVNESEAGGALGRAVGSEHAAARAAVELAGRLERDGSAIVTRGAEGCVLADAGGALWRGRLYERGPYPVGSGDAFLAGLVVGLERHGTCADALPLALGAATANAEEPGAGRLRPERALELAARAVVERL